MAGWCTQCALSIFLMLMHGKAIRQQEVYKGINERLTYTLWQT